MMALRVAMPADVPSLRNMIEASVRGLSPGFYTSAQIEASLADVFGVDSQLIADGTYYVIDGASGPAAAGGWSRRSTLYGGDQAKGGEDPLLDSATEAARIRAFFVHPDYARRGLARQLYAGCESAARAAGFRRFELMATLPGEPLYAALGFTVVERIERLLSNGVAVPFARMVRDIAPADSARRKGEGPTAGACGWFPLRPDQIKAWVDAHQNDLPTTLAELSKLPIPFRRVIVNSVSPEQRTAFWREHLNNFLAEGDSLSAAQRALVTDAIAELPAIFGGTRVEGQAHMRVLEERMRELLSREQAMAMFGMVGPPEPPEGLQIPPDAWPAGGAG